MEPYYYNQMSKTHQTVYRCILEGLTALRPSFSVPRLDGRELSDIVFKLRLDHPEIFYTPSFTYRFYPQADHVEFIPQYLFDKGKIKEHQKAMNARVEKLIRPVLQKSDREKEAYIHDFLCSNVTYDKLKKPYSHEIIGALGHGVAVCEGISKAVKLLCDRLGLWCIIVICDADPEQGIKYRHAWNLIRLDHHYYHLDVTFDNTLTRASSLIRYDYVNLSDEQIYRDHRKAMYPVPPAEDGSRFYYKEAKLSFTKESDVENRTLQAIRKKKPLLFHWRGGYLTKTVFQDLCRLLRETAKKKDVYPVVHVNFSQAVCLVRFTSDTVAEEIIADQADESDDAAV